MTHQGASIDPVDLQLVVPPRRAAVSTASVVFGLVLGVVAIASLALLFCCAVGAAAVLALYAKGGVDGLLEFYQELRFDLPLRTQLGAASVSALYAGVALATVVVAVWRERLGWTRRVALRGVPRVRASAFAVFATTIAYAAMATLVMAAMRGTHVVISGPTDLVLLGTIATNLVVLAPLAEELFFRGWLYTGLRDRLAFWPSFVLTASLFAAIHWDASHRRIFLVLPLAVALGVLREITGSIKPTIALHGLYNLIIVGITLLEA